MVMIGEPVRAYAAILLFFMLAPWRAGAGPLELTGQVEARFVSSNSMHSWTESGLGKLRYDRQDDPWQLGQFALRTAGDLTDTLSGIAVISANADRRGVLDVNEFFLSWNPVPEGPWRMRARAGAFFLKSSIEIGADSLGWTPSDTISSAAINSWIGEELRTNGVEWTAKREGKLNGSAHSFGLSAGLFGGNDPAGTLLAWRGWSISDRITGLTESIQLADLAVYRPNGPIDKQTRGMRVFREIDHRAGYYVSANYDFRHVIEVSGLHYDNRGDPLIVKDGQYSWHTTFDHIALRVRPAPRWEVLMQALTGDTKMGPDAVNVRYRSAYVMAKYRSGPGTWSIRWDRFDIRENDILPQDANGESGHSAALAYHHRFSDAFSLIAEVVALRSARAARREIGEPINQHERSATAALRWRF